MKAAISFLTAFLFLLSAGSAIAQKQPPAMSPDYFPERWEEFTYQDDLFKIHFPKTPQVASIPGKKGETTRIYKHRSFVAFEIRVTTFPATLEGKIPVEALFEEMKKLGLEGIKNYNPKIIAETDITQDGKAGRFIHAETSDGAVLRMKFFLSGARIFYLFAETEKGAKHGINWENDFEKVAMGFLDSFKLL